MKETQAIIDTPFAQLAIKVQQSYVADAPHEFVTGIDFLPANSKKAFLSSPFTERLSQEIKYYLQNATHSFDINFSLIGTDFQKSVWRVMQKIEPGKTLTYGEVANQLGSSPRAVGNACRRNPIPLLVPCHRIVAKNGLGGFAGHTSGDVFDIKRWLLHHEALLK